MVAEFVVFAGDAGGVDAPFHMSGIVRLLQRWECCACSVALTECVLSPDGTHSASYIDCEQTAEGDVNSFFFECSDSTV